MPVSGAGAHFIARHRDEPLRRQNDPDDVQPYGQVPFVSFGIAFCALADGTLERFARRVAMRTAAAGPGGFGTGSGWAQAMPVRATTAMVPANVFMALPAPFESNLPP